jgi:sec-independent protein translocase protein TatC
MAHSFPSRLRRVGRDERLPVTDHLHELRRRLIVSVGALVVAFAAAYAVHDRILAWLVGPLPDEHRRLVTLSPTEPFVTTLKITLAAAVLVTLPIWLYQLYAFVIPAVSDQSRRRMLAVVGGVAALFAGGVAFGYAVVLPVAMRFLLGFGDGVFTTQLRAAEYVGFATTMLLAAGLLFEVPVAMLALARMGLVTAQAFRRHWRIAIVVIAFIAAILPGGDPLSMLLLMVPQIVLYGLGIWLASIFGRDPVWTREAWRAEPEAAG